MRLCLPIAVCLVLAGLFPRAATAQDKKPSYTISRWAVWVDDDMRYAEPEWDDSRWHDLFLWIDSPASDTAAVFWSRLQVDINTPKQPHTRMGLDLSILGAIEVYWDGYLIGQSGQVGSTLEDEVPGPIDNMFFIPDSLYTPGTHLLALRVSNFHLKKRIRYYIHRIAIGEYADRAMQLLRGSLVPLIFLGGFLIIGIYYLLLYSITTRRLSSLLFSLLCFSVSALLVAESWRGVYGYTYDWHFIRMLAVTGTLFVISLLLPAFFMVQFSFPKKGAWLSLLVVLLGLSVYLQTGFDSKNQYMAFSMMALSTIITVWAVLQNKEGSWFALGGVGICLMFLFENPDAFAEQTFFLAFGGLIVCVLASLTVQRKKQRTQHEQALINAVRLEVELLKKNIQPHYVMNSLTSVIAWIEEDPKTGIKLIEALADEFRILSEVSGQKLIPLKQEVDLCRSHLAIMSYRKDVQFDLVIEGLDYDEQVPPALFHTLIENGITHNAFDASHIRFHLTRTPLPRGRRYTFVSPTDGSHTTNDRPDGTGLRYIKARLNESYGTRWHLVSALSPQGWKTIIEVYA